MAFSPSCPAETQSSACLHMPGRNQASSCLPQARSHGTAHPSLGNNHRRKEVLPTQGRVAQTVDPSWNQPCPGCAADVRPLETLTSCVKLNFLPSTSLPKFTIGLLGDMAEQLPGASGTGNLTPDKSRGSDSAATQQKRYLV